MSLDALAIVGPTASGKTGLAIAVAKRLGGEIVSMDSRQVYRGMDIGTAKASPAERAAVPHHGLDLVDPDERYSAGAFARDARRWVGEIRARRHVPILAGGTGFFLRALTHPLFREPELDPTRRERLKRWLASQSEAELRRWLQRLDPASAGALTEAGGRQRRARALEVALLSGRPLSWWHLHAAAEARPLALRVYVLDLPRAELYRRIEERAGGMLAAGLEREVRGLLARGYDEQAPGLNATGYVELLPYLRGEASLETAVDAIQRATRRLARRQLTWLRHQLPAGAVHLDATRPPDELADTIATAWLQEGGGS